MLDFLYGWYLHEDYGAKLINVVFEKTLLPDDSGSWTLTDAEDGSTLSSDLGVYDLFLLDVFSYARTGFVKLTAYPDNDTSKKFIIEATEKPYRLPLLPPKLMEADLVIDYVNEGQLNDVYLSFRAIKFPQDHLADITILAEQLPVVLDNLNQRGYDIVSQLNTIITQLDQLIELNGGEPVGESGLVSLPGEEAETKNFCKRSS